MILILLCTQSSLQQQGRWYLIGIAHSVTWAIVRSIKILSGLNVCRVRLLLLTFRLKQLLLLLHSLNIDFVVIVRGHTENSLIIRLLILLRLFGRPLHYLHTLFCDLAFFQGRRLYSSVKSGRVYLPWTWAQTALGAGYLQGEKLPTHPHSRSSATVLSSDYYSAINFYFAMAAQACCYSCSF